MLGVYGKAQPVQAGLMSGKDLCPAGCLPVLLRDAQGVRRSAERNTGVI